MDRTRGEAGHGIGSRVVMAAAANLATSKISANAYLIRKPSSSAMPRRPQTTPPDFQHQQTAIPFWYHFGMSIQVAVRLPDDMVRFVDQLVEAGRGSSRAAVITRALDRERRHEMAVQDAAIYAESGDDADMVDLVQYLSGQPADPDQ
jgi:Arc/MetJ-type ribon-helix-helix transcriptional regulator